MKRISEVGRSQRMRIIETLKKTQGLSVNELGERLKLSYMGVKQHCDELERHGYVDTWRRPKPVGRPEMVYRLTPKAQVFFPRCDQCNDDRNPARCQSALWSRGRGEIVVLGLRLKDRGVHAEVARKDSCRNWPKCS